MGPRRLAFGFFASAVVLAAMQGVAWTKGIGVDAGVSQTSYAWAMPRLEGAYWGVAEGDVDGDGRREIMLLSRRRVDIGTVDVDQEKFLKEMACDLPGEAEGARVSTIDLNDDGKEEIVVSAVEEGLPASAVFAVDGRACHPLVRRARWSLRAMEDGDGKMFLAGQGWSSPSFFQGSIFRIALEKGHLADAGAVALPRGTRLFQYAFLPPASDGSARVVLLPGYAPMEVRQQSGRRWKRVWRSGERFGGSPNLLAASQRDLLGSERSDTVAFDLPPLWMSDRGSPLLMGVSNRLPLRNVIGRRPGISGSRAIAFSEDPALGFLPSWETVEIPGCIEDAVMAPSGDAGSPGLLVLAQNECGLFLNPTQSQLIFFGAVAGQR